MHKINEILQKKSYYDCARVGCLVAGYGPQENFSRNDFEFIEKDFEGIKFSIIKGYDNYLRALYKNYMKLPPKEKRIAAHDYIAYEK